ncbi:regulator of microtubule dynamics protein 2 isoform X1 [Tachyglossus aculeatus]|uniref:regulator of microtubule dynamics protein 2 isoform X1 n=1 Tax=Tachyglossus aculeatus TaxID=9261 RepID=UPI0018F68641|nr:regulator of microtubule dynamics protein 2 isoform X1 [Tachyglossus aculeatus]
MSQSSNKGLIFGIMIGTAGVSLALVWYRKIRKSLAVIRLPGFWALNDAFPSAEELHGERGTVTALQGRQLQILEKLNSLVASLEELKEEVRCLKEAIPKLEEHVRGELRGKAGVSRESPHRRKRRSEPILSHSSEETESEGGCCFPDKTPIQDSSQDGLSSSTCQDEALSDSSQSSHSSQSEIEVRSDSIHFSEAGLRHAGPSVTGPLSPYPINPRSSYAVSNLFLNIRSLHSLSALSQLSSSTVSRQSTSASGQDSQIGLFPQQADMNQAPQDGPSPEPLADDTPSESLRRESQVTAGPLQDRATSASHPNPELQDVFEVTPTSDSSLSSYLTAPDLESDEEKAPVNKIQTEELDAFLSKVDSLQRSREINRKHILKLLCENEETFGEEVEFIWRLARGYGEVIQNSLDTEEKKIFANIGRNVSEKALHMAPTNGYCQLWYAILCGYMSELEGLQSKLHYAFLFKEHMMKAIELIPEEPQVHYLRGRYCYDVAKLSWIERKMAATIFGSPPTSTIEEALSNFLKAEEIKPGFSKMNYVFLAKCYRDLRQRGSALKYCDCALMLPTLNVEDKQAHQDVEKVIYSLKNK